MKIRQKAKETSAKEAAKVSMNEFIAGQRDREKWIEEDQIRDVLTTAEVTLTNGRRQDINEFCSYVGRDAETGAQIFQDEIHEKFQMLADVHRRLILMAFPESGKTTQLGILRVLHELGKNHNLRVAVLSKVQQNATKTTRAIREYIEKSLELKDVFPDLRRGNQWEDSVFTIDRDSFSKDPSVQAVGLDGSITGSRIDLLIIDDVLDSTNTDSPAALAKTLKRIKSNFMDRLTKDGRVVFLTNAWHPEDAAHKLHRDSGWTMYKFPVMDRETGELKWPLKWSLERISRESEELGPVEASRSLFCQPRGEGENPFDVDALEKAFVQSSELELIHSLSVHDLPQGALIVHGVDLAPTKTKASHLTTISTVMLWPEDWSRQLLWFESGRWSSREIRQRVLDHARRYRGSFFVVENNAAQRWILDIIENQADLPIEERILPELIPFTTGRNKAHPQLGVEGVAVEISNGKWFFPTLGPPEIVKEVRELRGEMEFYSRGSHTGDRLMGLWFGREGLRRGRLAGTPEQQKQKAELTPGSLTGNPDNDGESGNVGVQVIS